MKRIFAFLLAMLMLVACLGACAGVGDNTGSGESSGGEDTDPENSEVTTEPEVDYISMYYDDRKTVAEVIGKDASAVVIKDQVVTSKQVGTTTPDAEVLKYDTTTKRLIAVGTGTATVVAGDEEFPIKVSPAPITIVLVTGHSLGMGSQGNKEQSVLCEAGQVYMSDGAEGQLIKVNDNTALGFTAEKRPLGIDTLTKDGDKVQGRQGVDGGLGYQWNKLTGEKIWIVNCAVGGSCINQWQNNEMYNRVAIKALNCASTVIKNEVAAGHYIYKNTAHINFACANFGYQKVEYDDQKLYTWHDGLWNSIVEGSTVDIDGDGKVDAPTCLGYVPLWPSRDGAAIFNEDAPIIYYRAASSEYPYAFIASDAHRYWLNDADVA